MTEKTWPFALAMKKTKEELTSIGAMKAAKGYRRLAVLLGGIGATGFLLLAISQYHDPSIPVSFVPDEPLMHHPISHRPVF